MRSSRLLAIVITVATLLSLSGASQASSDVGVGLRVSSGAYMATRGTSLTTGCTVLVPQSANGLSVLDTAKTSGCISSYEVKTFGNGHFVSCINGVCGNNTFFWAMYVDGWMTCYGVDDFRAAQGKELAFSYENIGNAFVFAVCL